MRVIAFILSVCLITSFANKGSGTAHLICKSESGRTVFHAKLQDITGLLEAAEFTVDGKKLSFSEEDEAYTIFDPEKRVFTVYISGEQTSDFPNGRFIQFWALPESFKIVESGRAYQEYEFKARIEATEPRKDKSLRTPQIELNCKLTYKI